MGADRLTDAKVEEFLSAVDPDLAATTRAVRATLLTLFPDAVETVGGGELGLGFDRGYKGLVFTVSPQRGYVNLGIAKGVALDDSAGLMEGRGRVHRHVKVHSADQLEDADLVDLLGRAVAARRAEAAP